MTELVHLETADGIATITLDSEHNRNALSRQLVGELRDRLSAAEDDEAVKAILIRSAGPAFCSGADLSEAAAGGMATGLVALVALQRQLATVRVPVVVELGGPVRAGGLAIVGAADIVIAAESVTFALTEVRLALAPAIVSLSVLPRLSDRAAAELFLTARTFDAAEAAAVGLITRVATDAGLGAEVAGVLADLVKAHPQGLRATKALVNRELVARIDALGEELAERSAELFASEAAVTALRNLMGPKG